MYKKLLKNEKMREWKTSDGQRKLGISTYLGILQNKKRSEGRGNVAFSKNIYFLYHVGVGMGCNKQG